MIVKCTTHANALSANYATGIGILFGPNTHPQNSFLSTVFPGFHVYEVLCRCSVRYYTGQRTGGTRVFLTS